MGLTVVCEQVKIERNFSKKGGNGPKLLFSRSVSAYEHDLLQVQKWYAQSAERVVGGAALAQESIAFPRCVDMKKV